MRVVALLALLAGLSTTALSAEEPEEKGFEPIFNGKDLTGWSGNEELWSVEDGAITGRTKGPDHLKYNQFLIWDGGTVSDFVLRAEFRLEGENNSGVQYRSEQLEDAGDFVVRGYQADIHPNPQYTGMLYDERGRGILAQRGQRVVIGQNGGKETVKLEFPLDPIDLAGWHTLEIIARGNRIEHKIDDTTTIIVVDEQSEEAEREGIIALQAHRGPAMTAQFRNLRIKNLTPAPNPMETEPKPAKSEEKETAAKPRPEQAEPKWIWNATGESPAGRIFLRKEITVKGAVAAARLFATADNALTIFLDGKKVLSHDNWERAVFEDIVDRFEKETPGGKHVIAIEATNSGGPAGVLFQLNFESGWRKAWSIISDESWKVATEPQRGWKTVGFDDSDWQQAEVIAPLTGGPWKMTADKLAAAAKLKEPTATPVDQLVVAKDFRVDLLYSVPKDQQGSWVSMCVDPKGRLIVCDQYGGLFRVTLPPVDSDAELQIEPIDVPIGEAQGLLWAFDSLYVMVNTGGTYKSGLYRVRDTDGDDQLDSLETLRLIEGGGEHGPHAVLLAPDGESLYVVCGNNTTLPEIDESRVPMVWDEDNLLPRVYGRGFMKGKPVPGGFVCRIDPDGKYWELISVGFRNEYDAAFNSVGDLFAYDADMEWDMNTPWYRPTRICHTVSGAEFGWRNGGGKLPHYYPDSLPPVVDIGPGSPTGVCFGYDAKFPAKYQNAYFACDWSYGKLYAVHLEPKGSSYDATVEEFITGTPLPLTDIVVNPHDGAMYFAIGGRRVQSGLYRVTYAGAEPTTPAVRQTLPFQRERDIRRELEELHLGDHPNAVDQAWEHLGSDDRFIRFAARVAIEHRPVDEWKARALHEQDTQTLLTALLGLVRQYERPEKKDDEAVDTAPPDWSEDPGAALDAERAQLRDAVLTALSRLEADSLSVSQKIQTLRVLQLTFLRIGPPTNETRQELIDILDHALPAPQQELSYMLAELLVYLQAPSAAEKLVGMLRSAPTQEEQLAIAKTLRHQREGWRDDLLRQYFQWFNRAASFRGGASFGLFVQNIKEDALKLLTDEQKEELKPILEAAPPEVATIIDEPREVVKEWTFEELLPLVQNNLKNRDFDHGRRMFGAAKCFACHRFAGEGGAIGPDLTALAGRFSPREILESVVNPDKVISDQYAAVQILTIDGRVITGRIVNLAGDSFRINTDMLDPNAQVGVDRKLIEEMRESPTSMMPKGLLNTLNEEELLDLMAYLLSRGDRSHAMFQDENRAATGNTSGGN